MKQSYPADWKYKSYQIKRRDGFKCRLCGRESFKGHRLTTHHIDDDKQNCEDSNLVTLGQSCHLLFRSTYISCKTLHDFNEIVENRKRQLLLAFEGA